MASTVFSSKVAITKRRATTCFNRFNHTILEVLSLAQEWEATNYGPEELFPIFDAVFTVDIGQQNWDTTTQFRFLRLTWLYLSSRIDAQQATAGEEGMIILRQMFAVPFLVFNNLVYGGPLPDDLGKSITIAEVSYRVIPSCF